MHRWRARVAVTILKPLRRRITARAARERACRVEATRTVRVARRVADARLRGSAAAVLAALDHIRASRVPALAQRVPRVVAQNFSASPKAFVHAGFRRLHNERESALPKGMEDAPTAMRTPKIRSTPATSSRSRDAVSKGHRAWPRAASRGCERRDESVARASKDEVSAAQRRRR